MVKPTAVSFTIQLQTNDGDQVSADFITHLSSTITLLTVNLSLFTRKCMIGDDKL